MTAPQSVSPLLRIGVFYDGTYFSHVSNYYLYEDERKARISITGLHEFIREEISGLEGVDKRYCQIVDAHYFRGRLSAKQAQAHDMLYRDRQFDDVLIREGVTMHLLPLAADRDGDVTEKGVDVWFVLEAYELAVHKRFDLSVLLTGDGDFVPLVRKLNTLGTRVMLLAWDFEYMRDGKKLATRVSQALINEVTYPVMMSDEIRSRGRKKDVVISQLFVQKPKDVQDVPDAPKAAVVAEPFAVVDTSAREGTIFSVFVEKGFGFIRPAGGGDNLFFHYKSLVDCTMTDLAPNRSVTFQVTLTDKGLSATNVKPK